MKLRIDRFQWRGQICCKYWAWFFITKQIVIEAKQRSCVYSRKTLIKCDHLLTSQLSTIFSLQNTRSYTLTHTSTHACTDIIHSRSHNMDTFNLHKNITNMERGNFLENSISSKVTSDQIWRNLVCKSENVLWFCWFAYFMLINLRPHVEWKCELNFVFPQASVLISVSPCTIRQIPARPYNMDCHDSALFTI